MDEFLISLPGKAFGNICHNGYCCSSGLVRQTIIFAEFINAANCINIFGNFSCVFPAGEVFETGEFGHALDKDGGALRAFSLGFRVLGSEFREMGSGLWVVGSEFILVCLSLSGLSGLFSPFIPLYPFLVNYFERVKSHE